MPYNITFLEDEGGVMTTYSGTVTDDTILKSAHERMSSGFKIKDFRYSISDYSQVTDFAVTPNGIKANATLAIEFSKQNKDFILVAVMPTDVEFGTGRMWQVYAEESGWTTRIVRTFEEADQWVKEQLEKRYPE